MAGHAKCRLCGRGFEQYGRTSPTTYCKPCATKADRKAAMVLTVRCKECGKKFSAKTHAARYCSDGCRLEVQRRKSRECMRRYLADPEERARIVARSRARAAVLRERRRKERGQGRRRQAPAGRGTARAPRAAPNSSKQSVCRLCGTTFAPYGGTTTRAYCKACTAKADRETSMVLTVRCGECGKEFSTKNRAARYCSAPCRAEVARRRARDGARRRLADPEKRAVAAARTRARFAARRGREGGRSGGGGDDSSGGGGGGRQRRRQQPSA